MVFIKYNYLYTETERYSRILLLKKLKNLKGAGNFLHRSITSKAIISIY